MIDALLPFLVPYIGGLYSFRSPDTNSAVISTNEQHRTNRRAEEKHRTVWKHKAVHYNQAEGNMEMARRSFSATDTKFVC